MKKLLYISMIGLLLMACTKEKETIIIVEVPVEGDPVQEDPDDIDGDGVKNIIEEIDGTNPQGPCSYNSNRQIFGATTQAWRDFDCDEDGVSNGIELDPDSDGTIGPNHTNERSACDYNEENQDFSKTTPEWRNFDCDQDGVTNGDEIDPDGNGIDNNNGTDARDECSLVLSQQTLPLSNFWLTLDCDADCRLNYQEIEEGTDPLDGNDFFGAGDILKEIRTISNTGVIGIRYLFQEDGAQYGQTLDNAGQVYGDFEYNGIGKLIHVTTVYNGTEYEISFYYINNVISQVTLSSASSVQSKDVQFNGNEIVTFNANVPAGLFFEKFTLSPTSSKLTVKEKYHQLSNGEWRYTNSEYIYDSEQENLSGINTTIQGYIPSTGEYYALFDGGWSRYRFNYSDATALNPALPASENVYLNYVLQPEIFGFHWNRGAFDASNSVKFLTSYSFATNFSDFNSGTGVGCQQNNHLPTKAFYSSLFTDFEYDFLYE